LILEQHSLPKNYFVDPGTTFLTEKLALNLILPITYP